MRSGHTLALEGGSFGLKGWLRRQGRRLGGLALAGALGGLLASLATWNVADPSFSHATDNGVTNALGFPGAVAADLLMQFFGLATVAALVAPAAWSLALMRARPLPRFPRRAASASLAAFAAAGVAGCLSPPATWPLPVGLGGVIGDIVLKPAAFVLGGYPRGIAGAVIALLLAAPALWFGAVGLGLAGGRAAARSAPPGSRRPATKGEPARPAPLAPTHDEELDEDEEGGALIGFLAHCWLSLRAATRRWLMRKTPWSLRPTSKARWAKVPNARSPTRTSPSRSSGWSRATRDISCEQRGAVKTC